MDFFRSLSMILDDNWSQFVSETVVFKFFLDTRNSIDGNKMSLKPRYFAAVAKKLKVPLNDELTKFMAFFNVTERKVHVSVLINGNKQPPFAIIRKPVKRTFLSIITAITESNWKFLGPKLTTVFGPQDGYDYKTGVMTLVEGSVAHQLVFGFFGFEENFTLYIGKPVYYTGSKYGNIPDLVISYEAQLFDGVGNLYTGINIQEEIIPATTGPQEGSQEGSTIITTIRDALGLVYTFESDGKKFLVGGNDVGSASMSVKVGENLFAKWM